MKVFGKFLNSIKKYSGQKILFFQFIEDFTKTNSIKTISFKMEMGVNEYKDEIKKLITD